jgi:ATP phosphoribosyltransferase regulatory subunit
MDLRELSGLVQPDIYPRGILAPYVKSDEMLQKRIDQLRNEGEIVVVELPGHEPDRDMFNCNRKLVFEGGAWVTAKI